MIVPTRTNCETPRISRRQALGMGAALAASACLPNLPQARGAKKNCRSDDIWLVSTRHLGCASGCVLNAPWDVHQSVDGGWQSRSADQFFETVGNYERTIFYIHGNRADADTAVSDGLAAHAALLGCCPDHAPVRWVIWSWPADQIRGQLKDVRVKAVRADAERYYLAPFLSRFPDAATVGLVGYSYGARVATGGLHVLGAASSAAALAAGPDFHAALWAAAFGSDWLCSGGPMSCAGLACHDWLITCNPADPLLKRYGCVDKGEKGEVALGYTGLACGSIPGNPRIAQINVSGCVGKTHDVAPYFCCPDVQAATRKVVLQAA